jgi:hypothetical protein
VFRVIRENTMENSALAVYASSWKTRWEWDGPPRRLARYYLPRERRLRYTGDADRAPRDPRHYAIEHWYKDCGQQVVGQSGCSCYLHPLGSAASPTDQRSASNQSRRGCTRSDFYCWMGVLTMLLVLGGLFTLVVSHLVSSSVLGKVTDESYLGVCNALVG